jgi:hypothetical protein
MKTLFTTSALALLSLLLGGCGMQEKQEKIDKAEKDAAYIMKNLDKQEVLTHFPPASFPGKSMETMKLIVSETGPKCDWSNRNGKFVDFCTISDNGKDRIAYIYEYFLKCDSLRFIMLYDLEPKEPVLVNFQVEPLERPNSMIVFPEKQLLNSIKANKASQ